MALHPLFRPGLAAWKRRDWVVAAADWRAAAARSGGEAAALLLGLAALADGLALATDGTPAAEAQVAEARERLDVLPDGVLGLDVAALQGSLDRSLPELLAMPPTLVARRRLPAGAGRFLLFVLLLATAALALRFTPLHELLDRQVLVGGLLELRTTWWAPLPLVGLYLVVSPLGLPVSPLMLAGGIVFGVWPGTLYNFLGTFLGAALSYQLARRLGHQFVAHLAGRKLRTVERFMARHGFWGLVGVRFLPIPFPVVNYGAAFAGVPFPRFLLTLLVGLPPAMIVYTWFAAALFEVAQGGERGGLWKLFVALGLLLASSLVPALWQARKRRKRYRDVVEARRKGGRMKDEG